jgi:membrane protein CcdC involved in cytochrome C biogenesis
MLLMNGSNTLAALSITAVLIFFFIMFIYHEFGVATNIINIARAGAITGLFLSALMIAAVYYAILPPIADYIAYGLFGGSLIFLIFSFLVSSIR